MALYLLMASVSVGLDTHLRMEPVSCAALDSLNPLSAMANAPLATLKPLWDHFLLHLLSQKQATQPAAARLCLLTTVLAHQASTGLLSPKNQKLLEMQQLMRILTLANASAVTLLRAFTAMSLALLFGRLQ